MTVQPLPTPNAPAVAGPYSPAVRAGDWIVLAGQVPLDPATGTLVAGDAAAQAQQVLDNIVAVLTDCGAQLTDVAKTTVFVTDLGDFAAVNEVYAAAFGAILSAAYMLYMYQRLFYGRKSETEGFRDLDLRETLIGGTFAIIILLLGILPMTLLHSMEPKIETFSRPFAPPVVAAANPEEVKVP